MKRETKFKILSIIFSLFLLFLVEIGLRIGGYNNHYELFNQVDDEYFYDYLVMNSDAAKKYFRNKDFNSDNHVDLFLKTKTDSTFRIFVQGASTVVGFPFGNGGGSFPSMLKHRLMQTFPDKNIEVVNTGITAVNSYTLLDFTDDIIKQKPDAVIIYAGHNEYYGALGVGSSSNFGTHPIIVRMYLSFKDLRLFQMLDNAYIKFFKQNKNLKTSNTTFMEEMVKKQRIPYNSKLYQAGIKQFEQNVEKILRKYKKHNIPVIISTIVCNEKDIKPFISIGNLDTTQYLSAIKQNDANFSVQANTNAMAAYLLGQHYLNVNSDSAKKYLHLAKELDLLRFRAPERLNELIIHLAKTYSCQLINMNDVFLNYTGQCVIGDELLTEHVHPNIKGQFLMADAFYNKMKDLRLIGSWENEISFNEAINDIPITLIDSLKGKMVIDNLKKSWPYDLSMSGTRYEAQYFLSRKPKYEELKAHDLFTNAVPRDEVISYAYDWYKYRGNYEQCLRIVQTMILDHPNHSAFYYLAGDMCYKLNYLKRALYYFTKYDKFEKSSISAQQLAKTYIKCNQENKARKILLEAKKRGFNDDALIKMIEDLKPVE